MPTTPSVSSVVLLEIVSLLTIMSCCLFDSGPHQHQDRSVSPSLKRHLVVPSGKVARLSSVFLGSGAPTIYLTLARPDLLDTNARIFILLGKPGPLSRLCLASILLHIWGRLRAILLLIAQGFGAEEEVSFKRSSLKQFWWRTNPALKSKLVSS